MDLDTCKYISQEERIKIIKPNCKKHNCLAALNWCLTHLCFHKICCWEENCRNGTEKKTAIVTGASKGIGLAIKQALEAEGVIVYDWSRTNGIDLMDGWLNLKHYLELKKVDILINNFGGGGTWDKKDAGKVMWKNYGVTKELTEIFLENRTKPGRVICISSIYGTYPGHNPYFAAAKAAQIMYMKSLAKTFALDNCTFNCVSPAEVADAGTPKNVSLKAQDVANLVVFLCSDKAKYISGENIVVGENNG